MELVPDDVTQNIGLAAGNEVVPRVHPLLTRLVLYNVFKYLKNDENTLLKCRAVNSEWVESIADTNPTSFCIHVQNKETKNIESLCNLLSNPNARLECQNLTLGHEVDVNDMSFHSLMEDYGSEIRRLEICSTVTAFPVLIALQECPKLVHLTIDPMEVRSVEIPNMFQEVWDNQLPHLRSLTIHVNRANYQDDEWDYKMDRIQDDGGGQVEIANRGLEKPFDFIVLLLSKIPTVHKFSAKNQSSLNMWNRLATRLGQRPDLIKQLQHVHLHFGNLKDPPYNHVWAHGLNLKVLEVENSKRVNSHQFSTVLVHLSPTLKTLTIQKDKKGFWETDETKDMLHILFQNKMPELQHVHLVSTRFSWVDCSAPGNVNLFRQLPKLTSFKAQVKPTKRHAFKIKSLKGVWQKMIPVTPKSEVHPFVHNNLREFCIDWMMPSNNLLVHEIRRCFPNLRKIGLTLQGLMLSEVIQELSGLEIQDVAVTYYGSEDKFASALTGISPLSCKKYERKKGQDVKVEKVRKTLADWISLRKLMIEYNFADANGAKDEEFSALTDVVVNYGLSKLFQLERLSLNRFEIRLIQISNILSQVSLHSFDLRKCRLQERGKETAIQEIRRMFPKVSLNLEEDLDEVDDEDFDDVEDEIEELEFGDDEQVQVQEELVEIEDEELDETENEDWDEYDHDDEWEDEWFIL